MKEGDKVLETPEIEGAGLIEAKSGEKYWVLNGEKTQNLLTSKGVEIGKTYEMSGKGGKMKITINGISDDIHGFNENCTEDDLKRLRENRAAVWATIEGENGIGFIGYVKDFYTRPSGAKGFIIGTGKDKIIFDEVDTAEIVQVGNDTVNGVLDLL